MGLIRPTDFAQLCNKSDAYISMNVKRGKIITESGMILDDHPVNVSFKEKCLNPKPKKEKSKPKKENPSPEIKIHLQEEKNGNPQTELFDSNIPSYTESNQKLRYLDTLKREKEIEKLEIEIAKKNGELVPTELVSILMAQFSKSMLNAFQNAGENLLMAVGHKKKLSLEESSELKYELVVIINQAMDEAVADSKKGLKNVISEYSEKKGVGQRA